MNTTGSETSNGGSTLDSTIGPSSSTGSTTDSGAPGSMTSSGTVDVTTEHGTGSFTTDSATVGFTTDSATTGSTITATATTQGDAVCGNGIREDNEECDEGVQNHNNSACNDDCKENVCGDGYVWTGVEECDAEVLPIATCDEDCTSPACGDSVVNEAAGEECDDGNINNSDECLENCNAASCGDGYVLAGVEECDDGNDDNADSCLESCVAASCGDGETFVGVEECDDGNDVAGDGCEPDCLRTVRQLRAGGGSTCALLAGGSVRCWGRNNYGQLGVGSTVSVGDNPGEMPPDDIFFDGVAVNDLSVGISHSCALLENGYVGCWGRNTYGQLGYEDTLNVGDGPGEMPPPNVGLGSVVSVAVGGFHTCVVLEGGVVKCWGANQYGQLGYGNTQNVGDDLGEIPPDAVPLNGTPARAGLGTNHSCVLSDGGVVYCWGLGNDGQHGQGHQGNIGYLPGQMPPAKVELGGTVDILSVGSYHSCAKLGNGKVRCWGNGALGQLGNGDDIDIGASPGQMPPDSVDLGDVVVEELVLGLGHTCALLEAGGVMCWGQNDNGQLGYGDTNNRGDDDLEMPTPLVPLGGAAVQLALGADHSCVLIGTGVVRCWGGNTYGQLGYGDTVQRGDNPGEMPPPEVSLFGD